MPVGDKLRLTNTLCDSKLHNTFLFEFADACGCLRLVTERSNVAPVGRTWKDDEAPENLHTKLFLCSLGCLHEIIDMKSTR